MMPVELIEGLDPSKEKEMLDLLEARVRELLETQPEYLMSYLYRLDVPEIEVKAALEQTDNAGTTSMAIAKALWRRQQKRMKTKTEIKSAPLGNDEADWKW